MISSRNRRLLIHMTLFMVAMLSIGSASILVKLSMASGTACAFWRLAISSLILSIALLFNNALRFKINSFIEDRTKLYMAIAAGCSLALHFVLWMESLLRIPVAVSVTLVVAYPLYLALFELIKERSGMLIVNLMGLALGFAGIIVIFGGSIAIGELNIVGVIQSFVASIFAAIYFYIGKILRRSSDLYSYTYAVYSIATLIVFTYSVIVSENVLAYWPRSWIWFVLLALIPMFGGHTTMNYLLKFYRSSSVTSIALAEPIVATILATVVLGERIGFLYIASLVMVLTGIAIVMAIELRT